MYAIDVQGTRYTFPDLRSLMAKATPLRSGDCLAGVAAQSAVERIAAQMRLADLPLATFLSEAVVSYEEDEVTRLILDSHDKAVFARISSFTVGDFRDWLGVDAPTPGRRPKGAACFRPQSPPLHPERVSESNGLGIELLPGGRLRVAQRAALPGVSLPPASRRSMCHPGIRRCGPDAEERTTPM